MGIEPKFDVDSMGRHQGYYSKAKLDIFMHPYIGRPTQAYVISKRARIKRKGMSTLMMGNIGHTIIR